MYLFFFDEIINGTKKNSYSTFLLLCSSSIILQYKERTQEAPLNLLSTFMGLQHTILSFFFIVIFGRLMSAINTETSTESSINHGLLIWQLC